MNESQTTETSENPQSSQTNKDSDLSSACLDTIFKIASVAIIGCVVVTLKPQITNSKFWEEMGSTLSKVVPEIVSQKLSNTNAA